MPQLFFDVRKFKEVEFGLLAIENAKTELKHRVGNYQGFSVDLLGRTNFNPREETVTDRREIDAMYVAQQMARQGFSNFVWISGPGGEKDAPYKDTRITWVRVVNVTPDKVYFDNNKAICSDIGASRCVELAKKLVEKNGVIWGEPKDVEELRGFVVGFKDDQIIERLADILTEMDDVFEAITRGEDKENLQEKLKLASWVKTRFGGQMRGVKTESDAIRLGAYIEIQMRLVHGIQFARGGAHGMSNVAALGTLGGPFNMIFNMMSPVVSSEVLDSRLERCNSCGCYFIKKKKQCPKCKG